MGEEGEIKSIVRLFGTDIPGDLPLYRALWRIKGIGHMFSNAIIKATGLEKRKPIGALSDEELEKLVDCIQNPWKYGIPSWMYNRQKDWETGKDLHLVGPELEIAQKMDIEREIKIKSWRGLRHAMHLPVRGQRTKSGYTYYPYRKHKRGSTIGVGKSKGRK